MYNGGQTCCAAQRFIVQEAIAVKFLAKFKAASEALRPVDPMDEKTTHGPLWTEAALVQLLKQIDDVWRAGPTPAWCSSTTLIGPTLNCLSAA